MRPLDQSLQVTMIITGEDVLAALRAVQDPELGRDLVSLNMVTDVEIREDTVRVTVNLTTPACPLQTDIERQCRLALLSLRPVAGCEGGLADAARPCALGLPVARCTR